MGIFPRTALLSDIHGNSPALRAVLEDIQRQRCSKLFMLGDIINGVDPHGCVELLNSWCTVNGVELAGIKGNAEAYLVTPDRDRWKHTGQQWEVGLLNLLQWFEDHLSAVDLEWVSTLPDTIRWENASLVHDSPLDRLAVQAQTHISSQYRELSYHGQGIKPEMSVPDWQILAEYMHAHDLALIFCGHTHRPFYKEIGDLRVCNVGSAGMPLDGDPRPSWVMLEEDHSGSPLVTIRRVTYDLSAMSHLIDLTPNYPEFDRPGFQEAYKNMFLHGRHWRDFLNQKPGE